MSDIGIVIPAYNEEKNIIKLVKKIRKYVDCYIIIVDDSENDNTEKVIMRNSIQKLGERYKPFLDEIRKITD